MKRSLQLLLVALVSQLSALCITYDYSYTFADGRSVSGTLEGDANGDFIENVSNVTLNIFGETVEPVYIGKRDPIGPGLILVSSMSVNAELNNFVFIDTDVFNTLNQPLRYFYFSGGVVYATTFGGVTEFTSFSSDLSKWTLTRRQSNLPSAVPDGGASAALLVLGMTGLALARRKLS